jgi:hypothetical protein
MGAYARQSHARDRRHRLDFERQFHREGAAARFRGSDEFLKRGILYQSRAWAAAEDIIGVRGTEAARWPRLTALQQRKVLSHGDQIGGHVGDRRIDGRGNALIEQFEQLVIAVFFLHGHKFLLGVSLSADSPALTSRPSRSPRQTDNVAELATNVALAAPHRAGNTRSRELRILLLESNCDHLQRIALQSVRLRAQHQRERTCARL